MLSVKQGPFERALEKLSRALGRVAPPVDRRSLPRVPAHGLAKLVWRDQNRNGQEATVHVLDTSPNGLAVRCRAALPIGAQVLLGDGRTVIPGVVRRCTPDVPEFVIGIEVVGAEQVSSEYGAKQLPGK